MSSTIQTSNILPQSLDKLIIHSLNVNSIISKIKRHYLAVHLNKYKPDILLASETCLNPFHRVNFPNYNFIRTDKKPDTRGTGILINNKFKFKQISVPNLNELEYTAISIKDELGRSLFIMSLYASKSTDFSNINQFFELADLNDMALIGGDFNAKHTSWDNNVTNLNGLRLFNWLDSNAVTYNIKMMHSLLPSRYDMRSFSFIDLFLFTRNIKTVPYNIIRLDAIDYESDHRAVVIQIEIPKLVRKQPTFIMDYSKADWKQLNLQAATLLPAMFPPTNKNLSNAEIDAAIATLNGAITDIMDRNIPKIKINLSTLLKLDQLTVDLMKRKKLMRRQWYNGGRNNILLKSLIDRLTTIIKELVNLQYSNNLKNILLKVKPGNNLFKDIKRISSYKNNKFNVAIEGCLNDEETLAIQFRDAHALARNLFFFQHSCE